MENKAESEESDDDIPPILINTETAQTAQSQKYCQIIPHQQKRRVPLTIITGFLGSGKSTLIQNLVKSTCTSYKIAIIENEYSANGIIESLILKNGIKNKIDDIIELSNGCICCSLKSNLIDTIDTLLANKPSINYILLEMSGLANPGPVATSLWFDQDDSNIDTTSQCVYLDGIITLIDLKNILKYYLEMTCEVEEQLVHADVVLLNKIDYLDYSPNVNQEKVYHLIESINPTAIVYPTKYANVDPDKLLNLQSMNKSHAYKCIPIKANVNVSSLQLHNLHKHTTSKNVSTITLYSKGTVLSRKIHSWLATILWPNQDELNSKLNLNLNKMHDSRQSRYDDHGMYVYRIKGIVSMINDNDDDNDDDDAAATSSIEEKCIVQAIDDTWEIYNMEEGWREEEERVCQIIVIGRCLEDDVLEQGFLDCFL